MKQDENGPLGSTVTLGMVHGHKGIPKQTRGKQLSLYLWKNSETRRGWTSKAQVVSQHDALKTASTLLQNIKESRNIRPYSSWTFIYRF
jgi:hypothetical protein